jgi:hypothetical protein
MDILEKLKALLGKVEELHDELLDLIDEIEEIEIDELDEDEVDEDDLEAFEVELTDDMMSDKDIH